MSLGLRVFSKSYLFLPCQRTSKDCWKHQITLESFNFLLIIHKVLLTNIIESNILKNIQHSSRQTAGPSQSREGEARGNSQAPHLALM